MNKIFNQRFWKYFGITFLIILLLTVVSVAIKTVDQFVYHTIPLMYAFKFCIVASVLILPSLFCYATSVSSFVTFRTLPLQESTAFFRMLAAGLIGILVFSTAIYLYDWNIQPNLKKQSFEMYWEIKHSSFPKVDSEFNKIPNFEDISSTIWSKKKLQFKIDSLYELRNTQIIECNELLSLFSPEQAMEVYESYKLEKMGVEYQPGNVLIVSPDSLFYMQDLLYQQSFSLAENNMLIGEYRFEKYKRSANAIYLLLSYLLFSTLGYYLRNKSMTKIFGVIAIVIVSVYMLYIMTNFVEVYIRQAFSIVK